jgi:type IV secretory pathway VirB6-like protein
MLNNRTLFEHILIIFNSQKAIQVNKADYERISDLLENIFMQYKTFIEEYYEKISSNWNDQQIKYDINNEYNVCLKLVNEAYENKQSELESNFFTSLRQSTSFKRN